MYAPFAGRIIKGVARSKSFVNRDSGAGSAIQTPKGSSFEETP
jgi:hypothetical protein